jgi:N-acetylmuramic acid 6-phosphate (MurNAc-6-P) etherase
LKPALVVAMTGIAPEEAESLLLAHGGQVRSVIRSLVLLDRTIERPRP